MLTDPLALFGVAAIAVVVLGQVPLVAYLSRYLALDSDADRPDPTEGYVTYGTRDARPDRNALGGERTASGVLRCPHCRTPIDPSASYEYCGQCAGRLPMRVRRQR